MAETRSAAPKVTYATLAAGQTPEFNKAYDEAVERVRGSVGKTHGHIIGGREIQAKETFADTSPSDTRTAPLLLPSMHMRKSSIVKWVWCSG